jgi:hypothetical protein
VLTAHQAGSIEPLLFVDSGLPPAELVSFQSIAGVELIGSRALAKQRRTRRLLSAMVCGRDAQWCEELAEQRTDVVFEAAQYFGWRLELPAIAWMPDFQHREMRSLFSRAGRLKRELGFRAQVHSGRTIMLSSEHARGLCESYYPSTIGRAFTVRFAVPAVEGIDAVEARRIADLYALPEHFFYMPNQFWQHKNHLLVLEALAILKSRGVQVVVVASGRQLDPRKPGYVESILAKVRELGLEQQFRVLGMVPQAHVTALMLSCEALLNPSRYEGWSTTVEEARSLGAPLMLSDIPVHREQAEESATYFDPDDAQGLAAALASFEPLSSDSRMRARVLGSNAAAARVRRFAEDFASVARQCAQRGRAQRIRA